MRIEFAIAGATIFCLASLPVAVAAEEMNDGVFRYPNPIPVTPARLETSSCHLPGDALAKTTRAVELQFLIGPDGNVKESKIQGNEKLNSFEEEVRVALSHCRFTPAMVGDKPVAEDTWTAIKIGLPAH